MAAGIERSLTFVIVLPAIYLDVSWLGQDT
jgi:hypothetical protein